MVTTLAYRGQVHIVGAASEPYWADIGDFTNPEEAKESALKTAQTVTRGHVKVNRIRVLKVITTYDVITEEVVSHDK